MDSTTPKPFVFVLMPFDPSFDDAYQLGIKAAVEEAGAYCERVDEQFFDERILDRIYNQIAKADVIVSDMSGRSPNVFYETGYAHALGKRVILLTQNAADIPFDLKHFPHIIYQGSIRSLKTELVRRITWAIRNPDRSLSAAAPSLQLFSHGKPVVDGTDVLVTFEDRPRTRWNLQIDVHNPGSEAIEHAVQFALISRNFQAAGDAGSLRLPDGRYLTHFDPVGSLPPQGWTSKRLFLVVAEPLKKHTDDGPPSEPAMIRFFTEVGTRDIAIVLRIVREDAIPEHRQ